MIPRPARAAAAGLGLFWVAGAAAVEIPQRGTDQIAHMCVIAFGGIERWNEVREVRYTQIVTRYGPGNRPLRERTSEVYLRYSPRRQCRIESFTDEGQRHLIIYDGNEVRVEQDGRAKEDPMDKKRALRTALSNLYLSALPFNLKDPDVVLTYRGETEVEGRKTYRIRVRVRGGKFYTPADQFDYFIDAKSFQIPQLIYTNSAEGISYVVRWSELRNVNGLLRPLRWDYMATPRQKAMSLEFRNLEINSGLPDSLFQIPPHPAGTRPQSSSPGPVSTASD
ncbi:MAG: hypothetical protein V3U98_10950 [Acidobacteriota bacterium]